MYGELHANLKGIRHVSPFKEEPKRRRKLQLLLVVVCFCFVCFFVGGFVLFFCFGGDGGGGGVRLTFLHSKLISSGYNYAVSMFTSLEQKIAGSIPLGSFFFFFYRHWLCCDVVDTDRMAQNGSTHGRAFATFKRRFFTNRTKKSSKKKTHTKNNNNNINNNKETKTTAVCQF